MARDLLFEIVSTDETVYDPVNLVSATSVTFRVTNLGSETLYDLGVYVASPSSLGDVEALMSNAPATDYEDILTWGDLAGSPAPGLTLTLPQNTGPDLVERISHSAGANFDSRIPFKDLAPAEEAEFTVEFNTPGGGARRFYIDLLLE
jgi:hypothetical protein